MPDLEDCLGNALCGISEDMARVLDALPPEEIKARDAWTRLNSRWKKIEKFLAEYREGRNG